MSKQASDFLREHLWLTRRHFVRLGVGTAAIGSWSRSLVAADEKPAAEKPAADKDAKPAKPVKPDKAGAFQEPYFTPTAHFRDVSRGKPLPHSLPEEKMREVGLTRETWKLEITSDPENKARLGQELKKEDGTALDFNALLELGKKHAVRFPKVMTCLNLGCPLGMGLWEGVPLRELIALTEPREDVRRVVFWGYHNDDEKQMFRGSLPISRVQEDPYGLPPVIACYKLNGEWLDPERGGPVRMVIPEAYGFKNIKWLTNVVLTNLWYANDTYGSQNNDVDSPMKSFAATLGAPREVKPNEKIAVSGYAQVGQAGVAKVQVSIESSDKPRPSGDPHFTQCEWIDAELMPAPTTWDVLADGKLPADVHGFDDKGKPKTWPMRFTKTHWAAVLPGLPEGNYSLRSRTIDTQGHAQPMPRPLKKSGHSQIETVQIKVKA